MSRVGQKPVEIPQGVTVAVNGPLVTVKGKLGELNWTLPATITAEVVDGKVKVGAAEQTRQCRSFHGLSRSLIANMIEGVAKGFSKRLEIEGVGFKAVVQGQRLELALGYSPIENEKTKDKNKPQIQYDVPEGVKCQVEGGTAIVLSGPDKQKVGDTAARIRSFYKAEPYKGKGIRYTGERVRRKVGKTVA